MLHDVRTQIILDGQALQQEWGGADQPYLNVRVSSEEGSGDPGPPAYVSMKAVYTDRDLFLLVQWTDPTENNAKDAMYYMGPDSIYKLPHDPRGCVPALKSEFYWMRNPEQDEDRVSIAFLIDTTSTGNPLSDFGTRGCLMACHGGETPVFGRVESGYLDVWEWLASRTNPVRDLYTRRDDPGSPRYGVCGYLEDLYADAIGGLQPDPGTSSFWPNFDEGSNVPLWVYRRADDTLIDPTNPNLRNEWGEKARKNNGLSIAYLWREDPDLEVSHFSECDTMNEAPLPLGTPNHTWTTGDRAPGYILTYPRGSRADIHATGLFNAGVWTLEIGRLLATSDAIHDVTFAPAPERKYIFTVAVMDNSGRVHRGSQPQILVFDPKGRAR